MKSSFVPGIPPNGALSLLRNLVHEQTGLYFDDARCDLLLDRLAPLIGGRTPDSVLDYYYLLKSDSGARDEWRKIFDALTIQESFFWREMEQVRALVDEIVPQYFSSKPDDTLDIWSAACAGGEEPLSIAMALHEAGWFDKARINIHGSDASPRAIQGAQNGIFPERSFRSLPPELREKYFVDAEGGMRISCDLRSKVRWQITNLMSESDLLWAPTGSQIIFCRNMFIYFSESAARKTVRVFAERMKRPGYLFLGAAESLLQMPTQLEPKEIGSAFVYVKGSQ